MRIAILSTDDRDELRRYSDPDPLFGTAPAALFEGLAGLPECEIHIVSCTHSPLRSPEKLAANTHYHSLLVSKWGWLRAGYLGCIRAIRQKLRDIKPDLVHGQGTERYCAISAVMSGFPNVLTIHGNLRSLARIIRPAPFSYLWLAARLERFTLSRTNGVVCLSNHTRRNVAGLARKTWIIPNAVNTSIFAIRRSPEACKRIVCAATVSKLKNQVQLIQALDPLAAQQKFELVFHGGARREDPYVQEFFRLLETRPWCHFAGFANRPMLDAALAGAALLVLPSLEDNCPMVVLEGMAAGVPVAAARVGGVPDLINDGIDGILFDPNRAEDIRSAVAAVLHDEGNAQNLVAAAKEKALRCFHPRVIAKKHMEVYREVAGAGIDGAKDGYAAAQT